MIEESGMQINNNKMESEDIQGKNKIEKND